MGNQTAYRPTRRERMRDETIAAIKAAAVKQVRAHGGEGLSLRAVARELGMSSPGLYRYYSSRDELLTVLVTDAYEALADALSDARDEAGSDPRERFAAACHAYFKWAETHETEFALIFGAPVPGYEAPADGPTNAAAARFSTVFLDLMREARVGEQPTPRKETLQAAEVWTRLHGVIALGLTGHLMPNHLTARDVRELYDVVVTRCLDELT